MPGWLSDDVLASWLAELVAASFAAAIALSFRREFPRADLVPWGGAWAAAACWAALGLAAYNVELAPAAFVALRGLARTAAFLQATGFLLGAHRLAHSGGTSAWLRRLLLASPVLGVGSALLSAETLPPALDLSLRALGSVTAGAAAVAAAVSIQRHRKAQRGVGTRLMALSQWFYAALKLASPTTLSWLGLLQGAAPALYIGFSLAPVAFALGCVVSLLEDRERALAVERDRLHVSEELFRAVVEDQTEMIVRWKPDGTRTFVNEAYCRVFGGTPQEMIGKSFMPLVAEEYREGVRLKIGSLTPSHPVATHVHESLDRAGERRWQEWTDRGIFDAEGRLVELQSTGRDVTEQREAERRVRESEQRLRLALEAARMGIWEWTPATGAAVWSERVREILAVTPSGGPDPARAYLARVHPDDRPGLERLVAEAAAGSGELFRHEHRVRGDDGVMRWVEQRAQVFHEAGRVVVRGTLVDVTERTRVQDALNRSQRMADIGALVAGVAHEVRTPLFGISANLDLIGVEPDDPATHRELVERLRTQVQRLSALMRDLLEYGHPRRLQLSRGDVESAARRAWRSCAQAAERAGVEVAADLTPIPFEVERDAGRIEQVFENLLSNAIHHAPRASTVRITVAPAEESPAGVLCTVEDEGKGIPAEDLPLLFEPFFSRRKGGTGLGLAIVQRIVEEHGGSVRASNRAGGGAVFTVFLPARVPRP